MIKAAMEMTWPAPVDMMAKSMRTIIRMIPNVPRKVWATTGKTIPELISATLRIGSLCAEVRPMNANPDVVARPGGFRKTWLVPEVVTGAVWEDKKHVMPSFPYLELDSGVLPILRAIQARPARTNPIAPGPGFDATVD